MLAIDADDEIAETPTTTRGATRPSSTTPLERACARAAVSFFYRIAIWMYWNEGAHARPHSDHATPASAASVDFAGELIAGSRPRPALGSEKHPIYRQVRILPGRIAGTRPR